MKKLIAVCMLLTGVVMFTHAQTALSERDATSKESFKAEFQWKDTLHDFGRITQNNPVTHRFIFKNKGKAPLILTRVDPSCGCTVAEFSREAIQPGQKGFIQVTFNAASPGVFNKSIVVHSNVSEQPFTLAFKGEVTVPQTVSEK